MKIPVFFFLFLVENETVKMDIIYYQTLLLYHSHIHEYSKCTWDVHYIYNIEHRNLETHVTTSQLRYEIFYYLLS